MSLRSRTPQAPVLPDWSYQVATERRWTVVSACGGIENARAVVEAVRACGSVDAFLQHLALVAEVRSDKKAE